MTLRTLPITVLLLVLRDHLSFTLRRLRRHPLTRKLPITGTFEQLFAKWPSVQQQELEIDDQIDDCSILTAAKDAPLNVFAQRASSAILEITGNDRTHSLYLHFFGNKPLHLFIRPCLAEQLDAMTKWIPSLTESEHASLAALGDELPALIEEAVLAAKAKTAAEQHKKDFREVGDRMKYVEEVNAARKEAHGVLRTLPHKHPGMPSNFADQFFKRDRTKNGEEITIETLEGEISALQAELSEKEAMRDGMREAEEKAAQKAAKETAAREAAKSELEALAKELELKQKRAEALKAILTAEV